MLTDIIGHLFEENNLNINDQLDTVVEELYEKLFNIVKMDRWKVEHETVFQFFDVNFASQIQSLKSDNSEAKVKLTIKGNPMSIIMTNDSIEIDGNVNIMHEAYYLDDPFVIDDLRYLHIPFRNASVPIRPKEFLINKLKTYEDSIDNVFEAVFAKEKMNEIMRIVNDIVPGKISSKSGKWTLSSSDYEATIDFNNLSAGLKSFVVLKMLLEKGILKEKDVLILDEPEIHLHPEWQIKYAEIIVLLQKMFDLNILVATHSRDFLEAIDLLSQKHNISDKCNYYLAKQEQGIPWTIIEKVRQGRAQCH